MKAHLATIRDRALALPVVARHWQAYQRADGLRFTRWAAAIALFGYLSLFPLVVLAFVVLGFVLSRYPEFRSEVDRALQDSFPLFFSGQEGEPPVDVQAVANATVTAGVVSVIALLLAGLGWLDATVEGTRRMLGAMRRPRNFIILKLEDAAALIAVGSLLLIAMLLSLGVRSAGIWLLDVFDIEVSTGPVVKLMADIAVVGLVWLAIASCYAFCWSREQRDWRGVLKASLMAAIVLGLLSRFAYLIVGRTLTNPVYGVLAIAAALLLFLYIAAAVYLYFACWLAVGEGAEQTAEERAFQERVQRGSIALPTEEVDQTENPPPKGEAGRPSGVDGGGERRPTLPPKSSP